VTESEAVCSNVALCKSYSGINFRACVFYFPWKVVSRRGKKELATSTILHRFTSKRRVKNSLHRNVILENWSWLTILACAVRFVTGTFQFQTEMTTTSLML
jgi:hypothetical protein